MVGIISVFDDKRRREMAQCLQKAINELCSEVQKSVGFYIDEDGTRTFTIDDGTEVIIIKNTTKKSGGF